MISMYKALFISPMIPSFDLPQTVRFFREIFAFSAVNDSTEYPVLHKDGLTIHLQKAGKDIGEMSFYLEVDDVDGLWESIKDRVKELRVRAPFDREYGMREFHIAIPHTNTLLFVGQEKK
jgi:catechol 2,3-dioxygenase-like lactoylglutathione lyase family enzyme